MDACNLQNAKCRMQLQYTRISKKTYIADFYVIVIRGHKNFPFVHVE